MKPISIGLVSTLHTNIGDDLLREGILHLLDRHLDDTSWTTVTINKHKPWTIVPWWHPERLHPVVSRLRGLRRWLLPRLERFSDANWRSKFDACDFLVQCGTPVFWEGCSQSPWARPIWRNTLFAQAERKPVLNLAAGSIYGWTMQPGNAEALGEDRAFVDQLCKKCRPSTVREELAQRIFSWCGVNVPLLPCTALLASARHPSRGSQKSPAEGRILVNYMRGAGHYDFTGRNDAEAWQQCMQETLAKLRKMGKLAFLCHNPREADEARQFIQPGEPCLTPATPREYFELTRGALAALCNRLHACVSLAGMGIPSIAVGTDTRLLMVKALELPTFYVEDARPGLLEDGMASLLRRRGEEAERLRDMAGRTESAYLDVLRTARLTTS